MDTAGALFLVCLPEKNSARTIHDDDQVLVFLFISSRDIFYPLRLKRLAWLHSHRISVSVSNNNDRTHG
jgi:hypothetical protein